MKQRKAHDNSAHQQAIETIKSMGWETSRFVPAAIKYVEETIGEADPEIRDLPRIVPDLYKFTDDGVVLLEVENTSRAVGRKMDDLLQWFMQCDGAQSSKENQVLTGEFRACEGATIPERGTFRGTWFAALLAAVTMLSGCTQVPCDYYPLGAWCKWEDPRTNPKYQRVEPVTNAPLLVPPRKTRK